MSLCILFPRLALLKFDLEKFLTAAKVLRYYSPQSFLYLLTHIRGFCIFIELYKELMAFYSQQRNKKI